MRKPIVVLGSTGKTGKRVMDRLQQLNIPVRAGSRTATPAFDWNDRSTWADVLHHAASVYISFQPDLAVPGASECIRDFVEHAKAAGVEKLVLLSGRGETEGQVSEQMVMDSGIDWTIIRAAWFMQNFSESFFLEPILHNEMVLPHLPAKEPFIDADDIADIAVKALTSNVLDRQVLEVTGPELLTFEEAVSLIGKRLGREISYVSISMDDYAEGMKAQQIPDDFIWLVRYLFTEVLDGRNESLTGDVQRALGRPPKSFGEYVRQTAATGVWNPAVSAEG